MSKTTTELILRGSKFSGRAYLYIPKFLYFTDSVLHYWWLVYIFFFFLGTDTAGVQEKKTSNIKSEWAYFAKIAVPEPANTIHSTGSTRQFSD